VKTRLAGKDRLAAFTLVELMLVLAIMSMLLTVSLAAFSSMVQSKGIEGAKKTITGSIFTARAKALRDKREVTVALSAEAGVDTGFVLATADRNTRIYVTKRMVKAHETPDSISATDGSRKSWGVNTYIPTTKLQYWALVVGGQGSGAPASKISSNDAWSLAVNGWTRPPANNSMVCIILTGLDSEDLPWAEQFKITSDLAEGTWEALPKFIDVEGTPFPITFRPDGSAAFPRDHMRIRLRDMRSDENWTWRIIVERGAGRCQATMIQPTDSDADRN